MPLAPTRPTSAGTRVTIARAARVLGALSLLAVGIDHIDQYDAGYSVLPTIGTLFVLNFVSATPVALGLLALPRRLGERRRYVAFSLFACAGIAIAAGSLAGLLISENGGLFGFAEQGYRSAIVLSLAFDIATIACLALFLATARRTGENRSRRAATAG